MLNRHGALRLAILVLLFFPLCAAASPQPENQDGVSRKASGDVLLVAQDHAWPPFAFRDDKGRPQGLLVDLWQALAREMGYGEVRFLLSDWQESLEAVREGRAHVHGGLVPSPERAKIFRFSSPLVSMHTFFFVSAAAMPLTLDAFRDREVGVIAGSYELEFMRVHHPEVLLRPYENNEKMVLAALKGRIHAFVADYPVAMYLLDRHAPPGAFHPVQHLYARHLVAAVPEKDGESLQRSIDVALATLGDEEIRRIVQRWMRSERVEVLPFWFLPGLVAVVALFLLAMLLAYSATLRRQRRWLAREVEKKTLALRESETILKTFLENTSAGMYILKGTRFVAVNPGFSEILGYRAEELLALDFPLLIHPEHRDMVLARARARQAGGEAPNRYEMKVLARDGQTRWVEVNAALVSYKGSPAVFGTFFDITERKTAEKIREGSLDMLKKVSANIPGVIYQYRMMPKGSACFPFISERVSEIFAVSPEALAKDAGPLLSCLHPDDVRTAFHTMRISTARMGPWRAQFRLRHASGEYRWYEGQSSPEKEEDGSVVWYGYLVDIQEWRDAQERITHMALHDTLTGLPNRILFEDRVHQTLVEGKRNHLRFALLFMDLDHFKPINDSLGHRIGDLVLTEVARRIRETIRASDTAARIGGDEFVILLRTLRGGQDAVQVAEKLRMRISLPYEAENHVLHVSVSIGIAMYPDHGEDLVTLTSHADRAMYRSKERGRDSVSVYSAAED